MIIPQNESFRAIVMPLIAGAMILSSIIERRNINGSDIFVQKWKRLKLLEALFFSISGAVIISHWPFQIEAYISETAEYMLIGIGFTFMCAAGFMKDAYLSALKKQDPDNNINK